MRLMVMFVLAVIGGAAGSGDLTPLASQGSTAISPRWATKDLRAGILGTDTSHVPAFTATFQSHPEWRIKVVAAFKGGSPDLPISANRVEGFARTIHDTNGVEIVDSIDALLTRVDVVLLESVDGRPHLAQVTPVLKAGKRVFIDKPVAASLEDVHKIVEISRQTGTPFFSTSSSRFHTDIARLRDSPGVGKVTRIESTYALNPLAYHPDLFYYGIHGVEALYAVMGTGCVRLSRKIDGDADITTGTWKDGRVGVFHGLLKPGGKTPMLRVWGEKGTAESSGAEGYDGLVPVIAEFFHTGRSPVPLAQTIEVFEFMTAAQLSKDQGGRDVPLAEVRK